MRFHWFGMKLKSTASLVAVGVALICGTFSSDFVRATDDAVPASRRIEGFELSQVRLLPSPFLTAQEKNSAYLLSVEPDRLLAKFRIEAGLKPKAEHYGGWEGQTIAGHSLGHYLGAVSTTYAATGDERFKKIAEYIVDELAECQAASPDGLLCCDPRWRSAFAEVARGDVRSQGFDLNGLWVPWYTLHKVFSGLLDAYRYCDDAQALEVAKRLGDWGIEITQNLTFEQFQRMLACEYGGTNEAYYNLYAATGDEKYLNAADRFYDLAVLKPLSEGRDELNGRHANTQFPKLIGLARRFEIAGDGELNAKATTEFFWERVVEHHSYAIGGNSCAEHFGEPDKLNERLTFNTCEICNSRNMLRLTKKLYQRTGDARYWTFFERALGNHLLAAIDASNNPESLYCYYVPLVSGGFRTYSSRENDWTCCHGTGMENPSQYNGSIYFRDAIPKSDSDGGETLYVNLTIPSTLDWAAKGIRATITSDGKLKIDANENTKLTVKVRVPNNCVVDGIAKNAADGAYWNAGSNWDAGTTCVDLPFLAEWKIETMPDNPNRIAFFRGPVLYAGNIGPTAKPLAAKIDAVSDDKISIPIIVSNSADVKDLIDLANAEPTPLFDAPERATLVAGRPNAVELVPFYRATERYVVYFDRFSESEWAEQEAKFEAERERLLKLAAATVDFFQPGEMQPERDANFNGEKTNFGTYNDRKWRDARDGGYFEFDLNVDPEKTCVLSLTYWGGEIGDRNFDISIDGEKVATRRLNNDKPGEFFDETYPIANPDKKDKIRVRLQGIGRATAGGIFGARVLREDDK